jgi:hypothetical protein
MSKLLIGAMVAGVLGLAGATELAYAATAKPERWCFKSGLGSDCGYHSLAQCKASRPASASCFRARGKPGG